MGHRLSKITTRTGDAGDTGIAGNRRLPKYSPKIQAIGDVDELNCALGVLRTTAGSEPHDELLARLQNELFNLGGELAMPEAQLLSAEQTLALENDIGTLNAELPPLREFVIPGGNPAAAAAHVARAICRRAERSVWGAHDEEALRTELPRYLNRLSDLLFVLARTMLSGSAEQQWDRSCS